MDLATAAAVANALQEILHGRLGKDLAFGLKAAFKGKADPRDTAILLALHRAILELHTSCSLMHPNVTALAGDLACPYLAAVMAVPLLAYMV